jgi:glucose-1-phosphate cytidylyltransferase
MRGGTLTKKELVPIGGRPILWHVMRIFSTFGFYRFVLPLGYEGETIKRYFLEYETLRRDLTVRVGGADQTIGDGRVHFHDLQAHPQWEIVMIDTGETTDKASRIKQVAPHLEGDRFFVTYGDGVGNVDLTALLDFHRGHERMATVTAVQARFQYGVLEAGEDGQVSAMRQYPPLPYWINAGFMLFERPVLEMIGEGPDMALETGLFHDLINAGEMMRFQHHGFWRSMDTLKDNIELEELWSAEAPWKVW